MLLTKVFEPLRNKVSPRAASLLSFARHFSSSMVPFGLGAAMSGFEGGGGGTGSGKRDNFRLV